MGTPEFAVGSLKVLVEEGYQVVGVITAPDKPAGRGMVVSEPAVKKYALSKGLNILQPEKLKNPDFLHELQELKADLQIVVAFRMLPEAVWAMPRLGTFNLHASLLPQYRGAAPINWAIINGEKETGLTTFLLDHEIDTGKILFTEKTPIGDSETAGEVHDRLMEMGAGLVLKTVESLADGTIAPIGQSELMNNTKLRHAPKIFRENCRIDWEQPALNIKNLIRGLSPYPTAWCNMTNINSGIVTPVKIFRVNLIEYPHSEKPGSIISDHETYLHVVCGKDAVAVTEIQLAGKKRMDIREFLIGFRELNKYIFS